MAQRPDISELAAVLNGGFTAEFSSSSNGIAQIDFIADRRYSMLPNVERI